MKRKSLCRLAVGCCSIIVFTQFARADHIFVTYNSIEEQLLVNSSTFPFLGNPFAPGSAPDHVYELFNNTGQTWTDFHFRLALEPGSQGTFWFPDIAPYDGTPYEGPGAFSVSANHQELDVIGLNIGSGDNYIFNLDTAPFELTGTYNVFGIPSVDAGQDRRVPDSGGLALVGLSAIGLIA